MNEQIVVTDLYVYPIKSCRGHRLETAEIGARGFQHDRSFMLVTPDGMFMTQREFPAMALIEPMLEGGRMRLEAPGMPDCVFVWQRVARELRVQVWQSQCRGIDQGDSVAEWLSSYLKTPCRLVRMADDFTRPVKPKYARTPEDQVGFADGYPFLLISQASLDDLNARLETPVPMNRFRPNIVVRGCEAFAEDTWSDIRVGEVDFAVVKGCARCAITTTDQATGARSKEPLKTLSTYRRDSRDPSDVMFGQNLIHAVQGTVRVGDQVTIMKTKASTVGVEVLEAR